MVLISQNAFDCICICLLFLAKNANITFMDTGTRHHKKYPQLLVLRKQNRISERNTKKTINYDRPLLLFHPLI